MLAVIHEAVIAATPQIAPHVTPQVVMLLKALEQPLSRDALQKALGLSDRKSFRERYLSPALAAGLIEMTSPTNQTAACNGIAAAPGGALGRRFRRRFDRMRESLRRRRPAKKLFHYYRRRGILPGCVLPTARATTPRLFAT